MSKRLHCSLDNSSGLFSFKKKKKRWRREEEEQKLRLWSLISWPVLTFPCGFEAKIVFVRVGQWFLPSPITRAAACLGGKLQGPGRGGGGEEQPMIKPSCHAGKRLCNPHPLERGKKSLSCRQVTTETYPVPSPPASHTGKQILTTFDCNDIWNVRRGGRFNSRKITRSLKSPHMEGSG